MDHRQGRDGVGQWPMVMGEKKTMQYYLVCQKIELVSEFFSTSDSLQLLLLLLFSWILVIILKHTLTHILIICIMSYLLRRTKSYSGSELDQTLSRLSGVSWAFSSSKVGFRVLENPRNNGLKGLKYQRFLKFFQVEGLQRGPTVRLRSSKGWWNEPELSLWFSGSPYIG